MENPLVREIRSQSMLRFRENCLRIEKCLEFLDDEDAWTRPNDASNALGNLLLHLNGNIKQHILSGLGGVEDVRDRPSEFDAKGGLTVRELFELLHETCAKALDVIASLTEEDLLQYRSVQGFKLTGFGIILQVVEHFSYHTGQIAWMTKARKNVDLGFYAGFDLNVKNIR